MIVLKHELQNVEFLAKKKILKNNKLVQVKEKETKMIHNELEEELADKSDTNDTNISLTDDITVKRANTKTDNSAKMTNTMKRDGNPNEPLAGTTMSKTEDKFQKVGGTKMKRKKPKKKKKTTRKVEDEWDYLHNPNHVAGKEDCPCNDCKWDREAFAKMIKEGW